MPKIAIVWDFDGTLTPLDSTTKVAEVFWGHGNGKKFWANIKKLRGDQRRPKWEHILASDAPIWMYTLSQLAFAEGVPLNSEFFKNFVMPNVTLFPKALALLSRLKALSHHEAFRSLGLEVHHFVVSAGLKELVELAFPPGLVTGTFGCRYEIVVHKGETVPRSVPVFCMDETMKTRSLFEISKGSFNDNKRRAVNVKVADEKLWVPFSNVIYIGDGDTDVPALSLVRTKGGAGIVVFDPLKDEAAINKKLKQLRLNKRADLITKADFRSNSQLANYLFTFCEVIRLRYEAQRKVG